MTALPPGQPARLVRRFVAVVTAGIVGVAIGAVGTLTSQGPGPGLTPPATPPLEQPVDSTPLPEASAHVLLAWTATTLDPALVDAAAGLDGVDTVSVVRGGLTDMVASRDAEGSVVDQPAAGWFVPLDTIAFDPAVHAELAPVADRGMVAGLADDEALLSRSSARLRQLVPGDTIELAHGPVLTVAGVVEDTTIGAAELAVNLATGELIGVDDARYLLLRHRAPRAEVESALRGALSDGVPAQFRAPGETPFLRENDMVLPPVRLKEQFGEFTYQPPGDHRDESDEFLQDAAWQSENLVERDLPLIGPARCHRAVVDAIEGALRELESNGLENLVEPDAFKGCWNPRYVRNGDDISRHAWGVAIDINYDDNPTGLESVQDPRLIAIFERWGFASGDTWLKPDAGHFEYVGPPPGLTGRAPRSLVGLVGLRSSRGAPTTAAGSSRRRRGSGPGPRSSRRCRSGR